MQGSERGSASRRSGEREHGYERIGVKTMNRFPQMLHLLIGSGYQIVGTEGAGDNLKVMFELDL